MNDKFDIETYFSTMQSLNEINIDAEWEESVKFHLKTAAKMAAIIEKAPIDPNSLEFSNCFHPGKE